jgi:AcrR family transcriptional regulator
MTTKLSPPSPTAVEPKKRSRTRRTLLDAALDLLAENGEGFGLTEVAARAGVSHGTFYNYFKDREELMAALVSYVVEEFANQAALEVRHEDPAVRFATISAHALTLASRQPSLVRGALRLTQFQAALLSDGPLHYLRSDLNEGFHTGRFIVPPNDATLDLVVGTLLFASLRVVDGKSDGSHRVEVLHRILLSLGIEQSEAHDIALSAIGVCF